MARFTIVVLLLLAGPARAELPPGSYNALRVEAEEALIVEIETVSSKEGQNGRLDVVLTAKVIGVERTKTSLKKGGKITIRYRTLDPAKKQPFTGPRQLPVLKKGEVYPAFLNAKDGAFEPAAYGESFLMTPEG